MADLASNSSPLTKAPIDMDHRDWDIENINIHWMQPADSTEPAREDAFPPNPQPNFEFLPCTFAPLPKVGTPLEPDLCDACQQIIPPRNMNPTERVTTHPWHDDVLALHQSSQECDFCRLFMHGFRLKGLIVQLLEHIRTGHRIQLSLSSTYDTRFRDYVVFSCRAIWWKGKSARIQNPENLAWCENTGEASVFD
jgi:hypothetical protein